MPEEAQDSTPVPMNVPLGGGTFIPILGMGTWGLDNAEEAIGWALELGYRHFDTAKIYGTEEALGRAIANSGVARNELFITTKLWNEDQGYESTLAAIDESLEKLGLEYVDLYLIHWPTTDERKGENKREETWRAMEEIYHAGKARAIGVSNYEVEHLEEMDKYAAVMPELNQIELHPFWVRRDIMQYCHDNGIAVTAYSPLTRGKHLDNETVRSIAQMHEKSPAQVLLRWNIQHDNIVIPKSSRREHIEENMEVFDFELNEEEMQKLDELDGGESVL